VGGASLEEIVRHAQGTLFDAAAQAWNHGFYWQCLRPRGGGEPQGRLGELVKRQFGDAQRLREEFNRTALGLFGSGWVWLVQHPGGQLGIQATRNAGTPDRRQHPAAVLRRLGARVLHRLPE
jgi:Fe-Mn family superoxide dismutase